MQVPKKKRRGKNKEVKWVRFFRYKEYHLFKFKYYIIKLRDKCSNLSFNCLVKERLRNMSVDLSGCGLIDHCALIVSTLQTTAGF